MTFAYKKSMQDFVLDEQGDLKIQGGDFVAGHSDEQHQQHILLANKGEYKEFPELGVGIVQMLSDDNYTGMLIEAKRNLEYDGMKIKDIAYKEDGKLSIDGKYKDNGKG